MSRKIGNSPFLYQEDGSKIVGVFNPDGSESSIGTSVVYDANGNVTGISSGSSTIKVGSNLVNTYTKLWMPYAGTWTTDGTPVATGTVPTGHLYAVGDKLVVPANANGASLSAGSWAANVTSYTTASAHGLWVGATVTIAGANPSGYNGSYVVLAGGFTTTAFTVTQLVNPGVWISGGTINLGTVATSGTIIPAGTYTITASATPNFSITRDNSPGVNLTAGTGLFDGITQMEVFRYTVAGGLMGINDHITGKAFGYYGAGSAASKIIRVLASGNALCNFSVISAGVLMGEVPFGMRNRGAANSQLYAQYFYLSQYATNLGGSGGLLSINTANSFDMTVTLQKATGTDALALWALRMDLERM
jgi:hypothetical protein